MQAQEIDDRLVLLKLEHKFVESDKILHDQELGYITDYKVHKYLGQNQLMQKIS